MLKKLSTIAAFLALAASLTLSSFSAAEARYRHRGAVIGGAALGLFALGAMSAQAGYDRERCYRGPRECHWVRGACYRDRFGDYECDEGHEKCVRPLLCD